MNSHPHTGNPPKMPGAFGAQGKKVALSTVQSRNGKASQGNKPLNEISVGLINHNPIAWEIKTWRAIVPMSASQFYVLRSRGLIETVKIGSKTLVITTPQEFLAKFSNGGAK